MATRWKPLWWWELPSLLLRVISTYRGDPSAKVSTWILWYGGPCYRTLPLKCIPGVIRTRGFFRVWGKVLCCIMCCLTWQGLCPFHHMHKLPLPKLIQAGQEVGEGVWLGVVMAWTHHTRLNGFQNIEEDGLAIVPIHACHHHLGSLLLHRARWAGCLPILLYFQVAQLFQLACCGKQMLAQVQNIKQPGSWGAVLRIGENRIQMSNCWE